MITFLRNLYYPSRLLRSADFEAMCAGGEILEQDERGIKVIQLSDGKILKIFRIRHLISGAKLYSYARRFCRNAKRLKSQGVHTVTINRLYHFKESNNTAVLYEPLLGKTLRDALKTNNTNQHFVEGLARFLSKLHHQGVHFHSLHTGNVIQTPDGDFGLIDISDLSIFPWPLFCGTRVRSFRRLCKYQEDIKQLGAKNWALLQDVYFAESKVSKTCERKIRQSNKQIKFEEQ